MSQDTRKDKRAKVVSLNVRYKSATVDEFIENHSHDVSKGGLFVKTPTPFPPGTLLKFEIRLAGDKSVISGVGRVVWKREPTQAGAEKPAGMGVKFIKIDDSSRAIIDRLITQKANAGSAYTSEAAVDEPAAGHPSTLRGLVAAEPVDPAAAPPGPSPVNVPPPPGGGSKQLPVPAAAAPPVSSKPGAGGAAKAASAPGSNPAIPPAAASSKPGLGTAGAAAKAPPRAGGPPAPAANKAATVMGVAPAPTPAATISAGAVPANQDAAAAAAPAAVPPPAAPPRAMPPPARKATMMGIGIPSTPPPKNEAPGALPSPTPPPPAAGAGTPAPAKAAEPMFPSMETDSERLPAGEQTVMKQAAELLEEALKEAGGSMDEIGQNPLFAKQGNESLDSIMGGKQSGDTLVMQSPSTDGSAPLSLGPNIGRSPGSPSAPGVTPEPGSVRGSSPSHPPAAEATEPRKLGSDLTPAKKTGGGSGMMVALLLVVLLAAGGVYAWQTKMFDGASTTPPPPSATTASPPPSAPPSASSSAQAMGATDAASGMATTDASAAGTTDASTASTDAGVAADAAKPVTTGTGTGTGATTETAKPAPPPPKPPAPKPPAPPKPPPATTGDTPPTAPIDIPAPAPAPAPIPKDPANEL